MPESVRVVEYSFASGEQRRTLAEEMAKEIDGGATVVAVVPVTAQRDEAGDFVTARVAVYYLGGEAADDGNELVATATMTSPSLIEEISAMPEHEEQ